ncbi:uncharacterized protein LOC111862717 [Cryptotermes secundus]|uniref:uncharacterized protein LOC111862717 n=1 Tax=Cryptotermes secundus TaxID=105785 RepID=UPI000CD7C9AC|nr:uncharacterized protein LOC111862717 [Cryptotermes secundus]
MDFFSRIFCCCKTNKSFIDSSDFYVPRCITNGSKSLGLKGLADFSVGEVNKRNKYEELKQEVKHLRQTTGLSVMVLECKVSQMQDQLNNILKQRARLWQEMTQLKEQFGMQSSRSEPQPTPQEFRSTFH